MEPIITIQGLQKIYRTHKRNKTGLGAALKDLFHREYKYVEALKEINLTINRGEVRGLIGPNGAGKSTLIKIISGILHPTAGEVQVAGFIPWLAREDYVRHIGVLFGQKTQLWWDLPAVDTFALNRKLFKIPEQKFQHNLEYFVDLLGIHEVITKPVRQLSLGERMKCEFVSAVLHEPELVYLDEPTIGLDILSKEAIRKFIREVNQEKNITFILTTHDLLDIENLCENVTVINKGNKVYDGSINQLRSVFENERLITIKLHHSVNKDALEGLDVIWTNRVTLKIRVNVSTQDLKTEIHRVLDQLPVMDINVNSISIEDVIKQLW